VDRPQPAAGIGTTPGLCIRLQLDHELMRAEPENGERIQREVALRKLAQVHAVTELNHLAVPPGNRLEALKGNRKGQHSIRINDPWRVCFLWKTDGPHEIEIVDYH
jgi:proteic killer suppression protein